MADMTKAEIAERILRTMGVLAAGQASSADDIDTAEKAIDSVYAQLRPRGWMPFVLSAVPDWAQTPLRDYVAADLINEFGISGERAKMLILAYQKAEKTLAEQTRVRAQPIPVEARYF